MKNDTQAEDIAPAPPDAPTPPAGEAVTAKSDAEARHHEISEAADQQARRASEGGRTEEVGSEAGKERDR